MPDEFINDEYEENENELEDSLDRIFNDPYKGLFISDTSFSLLRGAVEFLKLAFQSNNMDQLLNKGIYIIRTETPSCQIDNLVNKNIKHIITIDLNILKTLGFTDKEIGAVILHELGHIFNTPPEEKNTLKEFYADDYVRRHGNVFESQLLSGFKKYIEKSPFFLTELSKEEINIRIERIEMQVEQFTDGKDKTNTS